MKKENVPRESSNFIFSSLRASPKYEPKGKIVRKRVVVYGIFKGMLRTKYLHSRTPTYHVLRYWRQKREAIYVLLSAGCPLKATQIYLLKKI